MTPEKLREAVARAICKGFGYADDAVFFEHVPMWLTFTHHADAALRVVREALREPTPLMVRAARRGYVEGTAHGDAMPQAIREAIAVSALGGGDE